MIKKDVITEAMYNAIRLGATKMPPDIRKALQLALAEETDPMAKKHLEVSLQNADMSEKGNGLVCADTGFPMFFVHVGKDACVEGSFSVIQKCAEEATARATAECFLRPTMVHPLSRKNPGDNIGAGMPKVEIIFDREGDGIEIIAAPKGGGSEIFGTFYRMLFPADGEAGIKKFVIECIKDACYAGKVCPPAIIGVGIGGTADLCMAMAKKAALLRPIGVHHSDPEVSRLEKELYDSARQLGIGPMGSRGINAVLAINLDVAHTHTAALPVAVNAQCLVGRRWIAKIDGNGNIDYTGELK
ncbi:MAG: fumarate hydratase [Lentisphaerae bacterium]|nr:fumarate hydratase [Lentisphaerota bacterium]